MAQLSIVAGANSQSIVLFVQDSTSTTGGGLAAIAPGGGSLLSGTICYYTFAGANGGSVAISLTVLAGTTTAWTSGGIVTIDDTHMKGWVRLDIPNAVVAASKGQIVGVSLSGGTNMVPCNTAIELTATNNQSVNAFMTGVNGLAPPSNWNLESIDGSGRLLLQPTQTGVTIPTVTIVTNQLSAAAIATAVWQDATAGDFTAAGSIGKSLAPATLGTIPGASGGFVIAGTNAATSFASGSHFIGTVDTVTTVTNQLTAAALATAVWQDVTAGDFTVASSIGKSLYTTGNAPGTTSGLALVSSLPAAAPTTAAIAAAVWQDTTSGHFTVTGSIGLSLFTGFAPGNVLGGLVCNNATFSVAAFQVAGSAAFNSGVTVNTMTGKLTGDVGGRLLGGGSTAFVGPGAWSLDSAGGPLSTEASSGYIRIDGGAASTALGDYIVAGLYQGRPYWTRALNGAWVFWWSGDDWMLTPTLGVTPADYYNGTEACNMPWMDTNWMGNGIYAGQIPVVQFSGMDGVATGASCDVPETSMFGILQAMAFNFVPGPNDNHSSLQNSWVPTAILPAAQNTQLAAASTNTTQLPNLIMGTGSGSAGAQFTARALANAPGGGGSSPTFSANAFSTTTP